MKYKCFCAEEFLNLKVDEIRHMRRGQIRRIDIADFLEYYDITIEEYIDRIRDLKGIAVISEERKHYYNQRKAQERKNAECRRKEIYTPESIPDRMIAALYQVDFEVIEGKIYYDLEALSKARENASRKIDMFEKTVEETKNAGAYSELKGIDLIAMRIYRGKNRHEFSKMSRLKKSEIIMYEREKLKIPKYIKDIYQETLNVKDRHIYQLRDVMNGKTNKVVEDRSIPKLVKLKVFKRDEGKCTKCGRGDNLHYHHIKHFAEGGQNTVDNLTLLCANCHAEEHKGERSYHMLKSMATEG